jgi:hypothetical protein
MRRLGPATRDRFFRTTRRRVLPGDSSVRMSLSVLRQSSVHDPITGRTHDDWAT